jgi:hypothetical protein
MLHQRIRFQAIALAPQFSALNCEAQAELQGSKIPVKREQYLLELVSVFMHSPLNAPHRARWLPLPCAAASLLSPSQFAFRPE